MLNAKRYLSLVFLMAVSLPGGTACSSDGNPEATNDGSVSTGGSGAAAAATGVNSGGSVSTGGSSGAEGGRAGGPGGTWWVIEEGVCVDGYTDPSVPLPCEGKTEDECVAAEHCVVSEGELLSGGLDLKAERGAKGFVGCAFRCRLFTPLRTCGYATDSREQCYYFENGIVPDGWEEVYVCEADEAEPGVCGL